MQAQARKQSQETLSAKQSLATVQTLLRAGLGCITYLRDLLPQENFSESLLTSSSDGTISSQASDAGMMTPADESGRRRNASGFRVMTVSRGWSAEADKLLDYLEHGIFDAIEKQYLRSFIFAIYLDDQDPNNIVEAYTFNFKYCTLPGTNTTVPIMSLGEDLMRMSLNGREAPRDPVLEATTRGKVPTIGEVKSSLKSLIKTLIQAMTSMDRLPKRRFATFKVHYYPHTPPDYEPPNFVAGDAEKDQWYFTTHGRKEVPEKWSIGKLQTGWHGVDVHVVSVAGFIPPSEDNDAPFSGTTESPPPAINYADGAASRRAEIEIQRTDAQERTTVWDAEIAGRMDSRDIDAEGEEDPEYVDDSGVGLDVWVPLGTKGENGEILPLSADQKELERIGRMQSLRSAMDVDSGCTQELLFGGAPETVPTCVKQLNQKEFRDQDLAQTQQLGTTQIEDTSRAPFPTSLISASSSVLHRLPHPSESPVTSSPLPPSDTIGCSFVSTSRGLDTQMVIDALEKSTKDRDATPVPMEEEMLNMETQAAGFSYEADPHSLAKEIQCSVEESHSTITKQGSEAIDNGLDCDCGILKEDGELIFCDGGCGKWFHTWCMGYHSTRDKRLPEQFICFHCSLRNDQNWEMIVLQPWYEDMLVKYSQLALFRKAIKIAETEEPANSKEFTKIIGCEAIVSAQLFKRLETEGFISPSNCDLDAVAAANRNKNKKGKAKQRKNIKKAVYTFVKMSKRTELYQDYFNPDRKVEMKVMEFEEQLACTAQTKRHGAEGSSTLKKTVEKTKKSSHADILPEAETQQSQTQEETQAVFAEPITPPSKRKPSEAYDARVHATKKVKISMVPAVDLYD